MLILDADHTIFYRTKMARQQAERLLAGLQEAKALSEQRLGELHQADHLKLVTGRTSIDNAIAQTRRMIDTLDRTVAQLGADTRREGCAAGQALAGMR